MRVGYPDASLVSVTWAASLTLAFRVALFVLTLIANVILARSLGPNGRGVYATAVLVPTIVALATNLGIGPANLYYVSRGSLDMKRLVASSLAVAVLVGTVAFAVVALAAGPLSQRILMGVEPRYLILGSISIPFALATSYMQGVLHGQRRFVHLNVVLLSQSLTLTALLAILLLVPADRLSASIGAWTASTVLAGLIAVALVAEQTPISLAIHLPTMRALFRYGSLTYLGTLTSFVNYRFDLLLVNVFSGVTQVGLYAVAAGLAEVIWFLPNSVYIALAPQVAAAPENEAAALSAQANRTVLLLAAAAAIVMAAVAPLAIFVFFGPPFARSAAAVWLLLPGIVTFSAWKMMSCYLLGRNMLKQDLLAAASAMVVTLILDLALIPRFGFRGAALASSIAYTVAMLVDLYWVVKRSGLSPHRWLVAVPTDAQPVLARIRRMARAG